MITSIIKTIEKGLLHLMATRLFYKVPDRIYLQIRYRIRTHKKLNLDNPVSYNEKIQWLKMYYRKPEQSIFVDKYEVRKYVEEKLGSKYLIPLIGIWDKVADIDIESLPHSFILKCTHDSGSSIKCTDKSQLNIRKTKRKLNKNLKKNYYYKCREWLYKEVTPRIICEKLLINADGSDILDYKIFCFDGVVKFIRVKYFLDGVLSKQTFDTQWNLLEKPGMLKPDIEIIKKPENLEEMLFVAKTLSDGLPMLRADLYNVDGKVYFGEMTIYHWSGFTTMKFYEIETKMNNWFTLPESKSI